MSSETRARFEQAKKILDGITAQIERLDSDMAGVDEHLDDLREQQATLMEREVGLHDEADAIRTRKVALEKQWADESIRIYGGFVSSGCMGGLPATPAATEPEREITETHPKRIVKLPINKEATAPAERTADLLGVAAVDKPEREMATSTEELENGDEAAMAAMQEFMTATPAGSLKRERSPSFDAIEVVRPAPKRVDSAIATPEKSQGSTNPKIQAMTACIHPDLPTVVRSRTDDCWIELRCHVCGGNYNPKDKAFLRGARGMLSHYYLCHHDIQPNEPFSMSEVVRQATYHTLTAEESSGILGGDPGAYAVEAVAGAKRKDVAWKKGTLSTD